MYSKHLYYNKLLTNVSQGWIRTIDVHKHVSMFQIWKDQKRLHEDMEAINKNIYFLPSDTPFACEKY